MGRNRTGPPWNVGYPTDHASSALTAHVPGGRLAHPPAALQTTTTDASRRYYSGPLRYV